MFIFLRVFFTKILTYSLISQVPTINLKDSWDVLQISMAQSLQNTFFNLVYHFWFAQTGPITEHCVKSVQIRRFFLSVFPRIWTEYGDLLRKSPCSECGKIRTRKNSVFGRFSRSGTFTGRQSANVHHLSVYQSFIEA